MIPSLRCITIIAILLIAGAFAPRRAAAQALDDNGSGTTYILAFPDTTANKVDVRFPNNKVTDGFSLFLYSAVGPNKVRIATSAGVSIVTLSAGKFLSYALKSSPIVAVSNTIQYNTVRLEAEKPIIIYCFFAVKQSCEAWTPIPVEMWGTEYNVAAAPGAFVQDVGIAGETAVPLYPKPAPAEFMIIAAYDSTHVDIDDHGRSLTDDPGKSQRRITLSANQCYQFQSYVDPSLYAKTEPDIAGVRVTADRPIGLISGNTRTSRTATENGLGGSVYKNMLMEWIPSADQLGTEFVYMPSWDSHRPGINSPAERAGEYVRVYGGLDTITQGYYLQPGSSRHMPFSMARDTMNEVFLDEAQATYFKTQSPVMVMMNSAAIAKFNGSTPCFQGLPCLSYSAWAPYMVELTPREQWPTFAPYYAPTNPSNMQHYINVVCDTNDQKNIFTEQGTPFLFTRKIPGTGLIWGSQGVAQGQDHYLQGKNGARFAGFVYGTYTGGEEYRPGHTKKKGDDGSILGGNNDSAAALHPCEYEEYSALSYGYPLAPERRLLRAPDSLRIDTAMECGTLHVSISSMNANPVGLRSVVLDAATSLNVRLAGIDPVMVADILGRSKVKIDVTPIDIGRDAHGTLTIRDRTGKVWSVPYNYRAERLDIDSAQIRFGKVTVDQPESVTITCINPIFQDITVSAATFTTGLPGFSVVGTTPALPAVLKPGAVLTVRVVIDPKILQKSYGDTLHLKLDCRDITISVSATATQPVILVNDLDFGTMSAGDPVKSMTLSICNTADGVLKLLKQDTTGSPEILSWGDSSFTVSVAAIDSLQGKRLNLGECVRLTVSFNPRTVGTHATTARVWTNSRISKDTSYWRAVVVDGPAGVEDGAVTGHAGYLLEGIVPNPTGGKGEIAYRLGASGSVNITIYNLAGEQVLLLADGPQSAGEHHLTWDASMLPSGLYYCRIRSGGWSAAGAIVVAR